MHLQSQNLEHPKQKIHYTISNSLHHHYPFTETIIGMKKSQEEEYLWKVLTETAGRRFPVWDDKKRTAKQAYKINEDEIIFESIDKAIDSFMKNDSVCDNWNESLSEIYGL